MMSDELSFPIDPPEQSNVPGQPSVLDSAVPDTKMCLSILMYHFYDAIFRVKQLLFVHDITLITTKKVSNIINTSHIVKT